MQGKDEKSHVRSKSRGDESPMRDGEGAKMATLERKTSKIQKLKMLVEMVSLGSGKRDWCLLGALDM